uniref:Uncharacterized protein n=1 Tax=Peronospora matthiolae TaxID=2874970 RepID=A0AAV1T182_9STRA
MSRRDSRRPSRLQPRAFIGGTDDGVSGPRSA